MTESTTGGLHARRALDSISVGVTFLEDLDETEHPHANTAATALNVATPITYALLAVHAELKRANEQRDAWAAQVLAVLADATADADADATPSSQ